MNFYLNKYGFCPPFLSDQPAPDLGFCVVIPCFNEPDLISSLEALYRCEPTEESVEIIVVINSGQHHPEEIRQKNRQTRLEAEAWTKTHQKDKLRFHFIEVDDLPRKHAGVGLARKIGMDEAVHRFHLLNKDGIIVCFDADSECDENYLVAIERHFNKHPKTPGCSVHFEHPLDGSSFSPDIYEGITRYELHLRYYNQALKLAGLPYAFHTVGSSMAVRSSAYQKQGGMNKRKAGEDFYFIHKIIALGGFTELKTTRVIPSPRTSDRVPFGTGKAIGDWVDGNQDEFSTYVFQSFQIIKAFAAIVPLLRTRDIEKIQLDLTAFEAELLVQFLTTQQFEKALIEIRKNSSSDAAFHKRFFAWFDAFKILKMVHYFRDNGLPNQPILPEVTLLLEELGVEEPLNTELEQLTFLRKLERQP